MLQAVPYLPVFSRSIISPEPPRLRRGHPKPVAHDGRNAQARIVDGELAQLVSPPGGKIAKALIFAKPALVVGAMMVQAVVVHVVPFMTSNAMKPL